MTTLNIFLICLFPFILTSEGFAQKTADYAEPEFTALSGTYVFPKVYLKWLVKGQKEDGVFLIERKVNNEFVFVGDIVANGVPANIPILYCFNMDCMDYTSGEFRIRLIVPGREVIVSEPFMVHTRDLKTASANVARN